MPDDTNAAPAGAGEQPITSDTGPMGVSAAAGLLAEWSPDGPEATAAADTGNEQEPIEDAPAGDAPADDGDDEPVEAATDKDAEPAPEAEPTADDEPEEFIHGNARTRLRDGTVVPVSELKKGYDELRELRAKMPDMAAASERVAQYQAREAQIAQQEQLLAQALPLTLQRMQARMPPVPDPSLVDPNSPNYDPMLYVQQDAHYKREFGELQQTHEAMQQHQAQQQQQMTEARAAEAKKLIEENRKALFERIPEIADATKRAAVYQGFVDTAGKYSISKQEVDTFYDARVLHMIHDLSRKAAAYDKLMAQKPAVQEKTRTAAPVQQPGRRVAAQETAGNQDNKLIQRAMKSGRVADAAAALALFE